MNWILAIPVLAGGIRNVAGWLEASLKNGKIQAYEWKKLVATVIEVGILSAAAMYGLRMDVTQAAGIGVLGSFIISSIKKAGNL